LEIVDKLKFC